MKMFKILAVGFVFFGLVSGVAFAEHQPSSESATLSWDANLEEDIGGYKLYQGSTSGEYDGFVDVGNVTSFLAVNLTTGTIFWVVTAYDTSGNESGFSNEVSKTVAIIPGDHTPPAPPTGLDAVLMELASIAEHLGNVLVMLTGNSDIGGLKVE